MKKIISLCLLLLISLFSFFAENIELEIYLLNGTMDKVFIEDSINELYGFKMHLSFKKDGTELYKYEHKSPIVKIENLSMFKNLKKVELNRELHNLTDISGFESATIEELIVTYGLNQMSLTSIAKMTNLKVLYLNSMEIPELNLLDISTTKLEYIEISSSKLQKIKQTIFPSTLRYLNFVGNDKLIIDDDTIKDINSKNITVIYDENIPGIEHQLNGNSIYTSFPTEYLRFVL